MCDVQEFCISNTEILEKFGIEPIQDIAFSRQLHWLGKIPLMSNTRLPRKMLTCWLNTRHLTGSPYTYYTTHVLGCIKKNWCFRHKRQSW